MFPGRVNSDWLQKAQARLAQIRFAQTQKQQKGVVDLDVGSNAPFPPQPPSTRVVGVNNISGEPPNITDAPKFNAKRRPSSNGFVNEVYTNNGMMGKQLQQQYKRVQGRRKPSAHPASVHLRHQTQEVETPEPEDVQQQKFGPVQTQHTRLRHSSQHAAQIPVGTVYQVQQNSHSHPAPPILQTSVSSQPTTHHRRPSSLQIAGAAPQLKGFQLKREESFPTVASVNENLPAVPTVPLPIQELVQKVYNTMTAALNQYSIQIQQLQLDMAEMKTSMQKPEVSPPPPPQPEVSPPSPPQPEVSPPSPPQPEVSPPSPPQPEVSPPPPPQPEVSPPPSPPQPEVSPPSPEVSPPSPPPSPPQPEVSPPPTESTPPSQS